MPKEGYSSITVSTPLYEKLKILAKREELSVPKYIESILENPTVELDLAEVPPIGWLYGPRGRGLALDEKGALHGGGPSPRSDAFRWTGKDHSWVEARSAITRPYGSIKVGGLAVFRRHRLNGPEVAPVKMAVRNQLIELLERRDNRDKFNAEILFRVWWRLQNCHAGCPRYPDFSWSVLRYHLQPEKMVPFTPEVVAWPTWEKCNAGSPLSGSILLVKKWSGMATPRMQNLSGRCSGGI